MILLICFSSSFALKSSSRDCARSRCNVDLLNLYRFAFAIDERSQACRMQTMTKLNPRPPHIHNIISHPRLAN